MLSLFFLHPVNGDPRDNAEDGDDDDRDDDARFATESGFSGRQLLMLRENREKPPQRKVKATSVFLSLLSLLFILLFFIFCNQKSANDLLERERGGGMDGESRAEIVYSDIEFSSTHIWMRWPNHLSKYIFNGYGLPWKLENSIQIGIEFQS